MDSFIKADIFFFITTIAIVCVSAVFIIVMFYVVKILKEVLEISKKAKNEADNVVADVRDLRMAIREEGTKLKFISEILTQFVPKPKKARAKKKEPVEEENEE
jgi:hypothetical protein